MQRYHDLQWGVPVHNDRLLFEMINLEGAQAGLSWLTILKRRDGYVKAFDNFNVDKIVKYDDEKIQSLLLDEGIIRNRLKVNAVISNAEAYIKVVRDYGSFDNYLWGFVGEKSLTRKDHKTAVGISEAMSKDLLSKGFKFVGPTICYAFMQAVGMMNDHEETCFRYKELLPV